MKRNSKNKEIYEAIAALPEKANYAIPCNTRADAEKLRRTISIYLRRESPDIYTTSVQPFVNDNPDNDKEYQVIVYNYPKVKQDEQFNYSESKGQPSSKTPER